MILTCVSLTAATLPACLLVRADAGTVSGSAAAVAAWLAAHAAIAWTLRLNPRLSLRANPAFPVWSAAATVTAVLVALTPLGRGLDVSTLGLANLGIPVGTALAGTLIAVAGRRTLGLSGRL